MSTAHLPLGIAVGGALGASLRYLLGLVLKQRLGEAFPYGTLSANLLGCFLIGWLFPHVSGATGQREVVGLMLMVGCLGGFTTFSSFGFEAFHLLQEHHIVPAMLDVLLQVGLGLLAVVLGFGLARLVLT